MYIETLDFALSCTARNFVPRWYDLGLSRARSHWRHCDELKINHFSVPRPPCIVGRHALEYQCIPLLCKLSLLKTSECQTSQILLSRNLYNRHQVLENYTLLASALSEILIPPFSLAEVYKLASWPVLHFLVNRQAALFARIVPRCWASSARWLVSRPNRVRRPGHNTLYGDDRRCLGYRRNLMRAHLCSRLPDSSAVSCNGKDEAKIMIWHWFERTSLN